MEWIKIGIQTTLPSIEVLALNEETQEMMIGYVQQTDKGIECEDDFSTLLGITHFIYKVELLKLNKNEPKAV